MNYTINKDEKLREAKKLGRFASIDSLRAQGAKDDEPEQSAEPQSVQLELDLQPPPSAPVQPRKAVSKKTVAKKVAKKSSKKTKS